MRLARPPGVSCIEVAPGAGAPRSPLSRVLRAWLAGALTCGLIAVAGCQSEAFGRSVAAVDETGNRGEDRLAVYLADAYRQPLESTSRFVALAHAAARELQVDPLLVLAVIAVESSFDPAARNDSGARGLMQVIPRFHRKKLAEHGGEAAILEPGVNIRVGAAILKEYLSRTRSLEAALQRYVGSDDPDRRYARKVLAERQRLYAVLAPTREPGGPHAEADPSWRPNRL
jgi:soluble lytic murein transglycosylase-like protein